MNLINFNNINFNQSNALENNVRYIDYHGSTIQVLSFLPCNDKNDLIVTTLQKSYSNNIYNFYKLKMYFNLHLVYLYSNIIFNVEDKANEDMLYDTLKRSGLLDKIINAIDPIERDELWHDLLEVKADLERYHYSLAGLMSTVAEELEEKLKAGFTLLKDSNFFAQLKNIDPSTAFSQILSQTQNVTVAE